MDQSHANLTAAEHKADEERKAQHRRAIKLWLARLTGKIIGYMALLIYPQVFYILVWVVLYRRRQTPLRQVEICQPRSESCGFAGDADYYGLGQRIAIYMQWTGCLMARALLPAADKTIQTSAAGFALILASAFLWQLAQRDRCFYAAEVLVTLNLFVATMGFCLSSALNRLQLRALTSGRSPFANLQGAELIALLLYKMVTPTYAWFWMQLAYRTSAMADTPCATSVVFVFPWLVWLRIDPLQNTKKATVIAWFYFCYSLGEVIAFAAGKARQKGRHRLASILEAVELMSLVLHAQEWAMALIALMLIALGHIPAAMLCRLRDYRSFVANFDWERFDHEPKLAFSQLVLTNTVNLTMYILAIEMTLRWNNVSGVNELTTSGQLVAFVSASGVLASLAWEKWKPYGAAPSDPERTSGLQRPDGTWT